MSSNPTQTEHLMEERLQRWKELNPPEKMHWFNPSSLEGGTSMATASLLTSIFSQAPEGLRDWLRAEVQLLRRVAGSQQRELYETPYGVVLGIVPVPDAAALRGAIWAGPWKKGEWTAAQINTLARIANIPVAVVEAIVPTFPRFTEDQISRAMSRRRSEADSLGELMARGVAAAPSSTVTWDGSSRPALSAFAEPLIEQLRGLLNETLAHASLVISDAEGLPDGSLTSLRRISEVSVRGRRLLEEMGALARTHSPPSAGPVHLHEMLESMIVLMEPRHEGRVRFLRAYKADADIIDAAPGEVHEALFNLLLIAIDCLPPGGGDVGIKTKNVGGDFDPMLTANRRYIRLEVADSAGLQTLPGIDPLAAELLALDQRETEEQSGAVYELVRQLNGFFRITTTTEGITRIEVLLPVGTGKRSQSKPLLPPAPAVWVADDDPLFRDMCREVLTSAGYNVSEFEDGTSLCAAMSGANTPSLIVYDLQLPDFGGIECAQWLRSEGYRVPVILCSGLSATSPGIHELISERKVWFLQKPFSRRDMEDIVALALGKTLLETKPT